MRYQPPVPENTQISSDYGPRKDSSVHQEHGGHPGIDYRLPVGSCITAAADGVVERVSEINGYGLTVVVKHDDGKHSLYAHLSSANVRVGDQVDRGDEIARSGTGGTGPHLHFSVLDGVTVPETGPLGFVVNVDNTVNPSHLYATSPFDNFLDAVKALWETFGDMVARVEGIPAGIGPQELDRNFGEVGGQVSQATSTTPDSDPVSDTSKDVLQSPDDASAPPLRADEHEQQHSELSSEREENDLQNIGEPGWHFSDSTQHLGEPEQAETIHWQCGDSVGRDSHHNELGNGDGRYGSSTDSGGGHSSWSHSSY